MHFAVISLVCRYKYRSVLAAIQTLLSWSLVPRSEIKTLPVWHRYKLRFQNWCLKYLPNITVIYTQNPGNENRVRASQSPFSPRLLSCAHECKILISLFLLSQTPLRTNRITIIYNYYIYNNIYNRTACKCMFRMTSGGFCHSKKNQKKASIRWQLAAQVTTKGMKRVLPPRRALQTLTPITTDFFH